MSTLSSQFSPTVSRAPVPHFDLDHDVSSFPADIQITNVPLDRFVETVNQAENDAVSPSLEHVGEKVVLRLYEGIKSPIPNFFLGACDKIIIPFSTMDLKYSKDQITKLHRIAPGQGFYVPKSDFQRTLISLSCDEFLMMDVCVLMRESTQNYVRAMPKKTFAQATVLDGIHHLVNFAETARRILMSPLKDNTAAIEAFGLIALSETLINLQTRCQKRVCLSKDMIAKLDTYITENIERNLCLSELANLCDLSMHHFARSFKSEIGKTPYQYILDRRLALARRMLTTTSQSIADIAYEVGFSSQSHMTDLFRKILGTTPAKYRQNAA